MYSPKVKCISAVCCIVVVDSLVQVEIMVSVLGVPQSGSDPREIFFTSPPGISVAVVPLISSVIVMVPARLGSLKYYVCQCSTYTRRFPAGVRQRRTSIP
jgi:hypothetical protein